jgi:large subunit ribosomal protein L15
MNITDVLHNGKRNKNRRRVGRGIAAGQGKTCGRGHKGAGQRSGVAVRKLTEGGQMPLYRRIPKRGFSNARFKTNYQVVNLQALADKYDDGAKITPVELEKDGLIRHADRPVKVLGNGDLNKKLEIEATRFSASAAEKISKAGGQAKSA